MRPTGKVLVLIGALTGAFLVLPITAGVHIDESSSPKIARGGMLEVSVSGASDPRTSEAPERAGSEPIAMAMWSDAASQEGGDQGDGTSPATSRPDASSQGDSVSPGVVIGIIAAVVVVSGGIALYMRRGKSGAGTTPTKQH